MSLRKATLIVVALIVWDRGLDIWIDRHPDPAPVHHYAKIYDPIMGETDE